ncbi:MAG: TRAP transporter small permease [Alphaproteobacteria bacterium]|nr:MAG: TRAP transporter small permease [Alphaproteobacteria bacterium]
MFEEFAAGRVNAMKIKRFSNWLEMAEDIVSGLALVVVVIAVLWGVLTRYITDQPAVWTSELSAIAFTWLVFIGALAAFRKDAHVNIPIIVQALPPRIGAVVSTLTRIVVFLFVLYAAFLSFRMMLMGATRPSPVMAIPFSYVYAAPLVAFSVMSGNAVHRLWQRLRAVWNPPRQSPADGRHAQEPKAL